MKKNLVVKFVALCLTLISLESCAVAFGDGAGGLKIKILLTTGEWNVPTASTSKGSRFLDQQTQAVDLIVRMGGPDGEIINTQTMAVWQEGEYTFSGTTLENLPLEEEIFVQAQILENMNGNLIPISQGEGSVIVYGSGYDYLELTILPLESHPRMTTISTTSGTGGAEIPDGRTQIFRLTDMPLGLVTVAMPNFNTNPVPFQVRDANGDFLLADFVPETDDLEFDLDTTTAYIIVQNNSGNILTTSLTLPPPPQAPYVLSFDGNGAQSGSAPGNILHPVGGNFTFPPNTSLVGQDVVSGVIQARFLGWSTSAISSTYYMPGDTYTPDGDQTFYAHWSGIIGGIGPAGGYVFHDYGAVHPQGWRYIETSDTTSPSDMEWTNLNTILLENTGTAEGSGRANTIAITQQIGQTGGAAQYAADYTQSNGVTTYSDWFLPSQDESDFMFNQLSSQSIGTFGELFYWTSSEFSFNQSHGQWMGLTGTPGQQYSQNKSSLGWVRPIRYFRSSAETYSVIYRANGADAGLVPIDPKTYETGDNATILNSGTLSNTVNTLFIGWNTASDGSGSTILTATLAPISGSDLILYAQWGNP